VFLCAVLLATAPRACAERAAASAAKEKNYARHVADLRRKIGARPFTVTVEPPFVVIGDEAPTVVRRRAEHTVRWAVRLLRKDYFKEDPPHILDIWLFKDAASYRKHVKELFGESPTTPFGYYSARHRALVMNISTGGGTLVHEIVHPFMRANFPKCPAWFNEGLGSLYEQCTERAGHIVGLTNWRLAGLQKAIRAGKVPSFRALTALSDEDFYRTDRGTHYAQARYLCYYLQEKGLLVTFYREFVKNHRKDPTGYETLKRVLGEADLSAFEKRWRDFVLALTFP